MVTLMGSVNSSLPKISYMKALDIYLAFCFSMVFGALLEYATVTYSSKRIKMNQKKLEEFQRSVEEMRSELARKLKMEQQLVLIEEETRTSRSHAPDCPAKVRPLHIDNIHPIVSFLSLSETESLSFPTSLSTSIQRFTNLRTSVRSTPAT